MSKKSNSAPAPSGEVNKTKVAADMNADQLANEQSKADAQDAPPPSAKIKRTRTKTECRVEKMAEPGGDAETHSDAGFPFGAYDTNDTVNCTDMADGVKATVQAGIAGKFRVIRVLREFEVKLETTVAAKIV